MIEKKTTEDISYGWGNHTTNRLNMACNRKDCKFCSTEWVRVADELLFNSQLIEFIKVQCISNHDVEDTEHCSCDKVIYRLLLRNNELSQSSDKHEKNCCCFACQVEFNELQSSPAEDSMVEKVESKIPCKSGRDIKKVKR